MKSGKGLKQSGSAGPSAGGSSVKSETKTQGARKPSPKKARTTPTMLSLPSLPSKPEHVSANWKALLSTLPPSSTAPSKKPALAGKRPHVVGNPGNATATVTRDKRPRESDTAAAAASLGTNKKLILDKRSEAHPATTTSPGYDNDAYETLTISSIPAKEKFVKDPANLIIGAFKGLTKFVALDCEMVGVGENGERSALGRVSVVNYFGHVLYDKFVKAQERITDYRTKWSGIRPADLVNAVSFAEAQQAVADILKGRKLVAHASENDLQALLLSHPKHDTIDTSLFRPFKKFSKGRTPGLKMLSKALLGLEIQSGEHSSVEDARATMAIFRKFQQQWDKLKNLRPTEVEELRRANKKKRMSNGAGPSSSSSDASVPAGLFDDDKAADDGEETSAMDYETWTEKNPDVAKAKLKEQAAHAPHTLDYALELLSSTPGVGEGNSDDEDAGGGKQPRSGKRQGGKEKGKTVDRVVSIDPDETYSDKDSGESDGDSDGESDAEDGKKIRGVSLSIRTEHPPSKPRAAGKATGGSTNGGQVPAFRQGAVAPAVAAKKSASLSHASSSIISQFIAASKNTGFSATLARGGLTDTGAKNRKPAQARR